MEDLFTIIFTYLGFFFVTVLRLFTGELIPLSRTWDSLTELSQPNPLLPLILGNFPRHILGNAKQGLLIRSMDSLKILLDYFEGDVQRFPLFDVLAINSAVQAQLEEMDRMNLTDQSTKEKIHNLHLSIKRVIGIGYPLFKTLNKEYDELLGRSIAVNMWSNFTLPWKSLPELATNQSYAPIDIAFGGITDECFGEILKCVVTNRCWRYMTAHYQTGYMTTHQIYYVMAAQTFCLNASNEAMKLNQQTSFRHIFDEMCSNIYTEYKYTESNNYPVSSRDLYCEQVFTCGILGYDQFFSQVGLEAILSWQQNSGCYANLPPFTPYDPSSQGNKRVRNKRNEKMRPDFCMPHLSVLCGGALVAYIRYFISGPSHMELSMDD